MKNLNGNLKKIQHILYYLKIVYLITARYRITSNGYKLERFCSFKTERGKGFGKKILKFILSDLSEFNGLIYLFFKLRNSFYEKIGFIKEGKKFEDLEFNIIKCTLVKFVSEFFLSVQLYLSNILPVCIL